MVRSWISIVVVAACGGAEPLPKTPAPIATPPPAIASTTCADAGVILRGRITSDDPAAGPALEATITAACTADHWAPDLVACIGQSRNPSACIDRLSPTLVASYQARVAEWTTKYGDVASDVGVDSQLVSTSTSCDAVADAIDHVSDDVAVERDWVIESRKRLVLAECNARSWQESTKQCLVSPDAPRDAIASCMQLEATKDAFAAQLSDIEARAAKIAAGKLKPVTITCAKVVAAYYADAAWKDALDGAKAADRKKAIVGSRIAMQKTCTHDAWDDTLRACLATGGGATCFEGSVVAGSAWGFPALAVAAVALPAECAEYRRLTERFQSCTALPQQTRDAFVQMLKLLEDQVKRDPGAVRASCLAATQALQAITGC